MKSVREVLAELRAQPPDIEIAWQDFLDLSAEEQRDFLLLGLLAQTKQLQWCVMRLQDLGRS